MGLNSRLAPITYRSATFASVATNSSARLGIFTAPVAGEVVGVRFVNGTSAAATSGTTTGSSASIVLYANASNAASIVATFNGSGTTVATHGTAALVTSGTAGTVNGRVAAGSLVLAEFKGGAANNADNSGCWVEVDFMPGAYQTGSTASAGTGPA